jgi:preprotein translocase subunit YajC
MLFATAFAQDAAAPAGGGGGLGMLEGILPLILIFVVFYFLLIRPQQRKVKEHKALVANVRRGDRVVMQGGFVGLVTKIISDTEMQLEISDGVRVRAMRSSISDVLTRSTPSGGEGAQAAEPAAEKKAGKGR